MDQEVTINDQLKNWFQGNQDACRLMLDLFEASQLADDLVDLDQIGLDRAAAASRLLHVCLIGIPGNPFFMKFQGWLSPVISAAVLGWQASTRWETTTDESKLAFAFAYRDLLEVVLVQIAHLIGGQAHAALVQREAFDYFRFVHHDGQAFGAWRAEVAR